MKITIEVTDCMDCPMNSGYNKDNNDLPEYCTHEKTPLHNRPYILHMFPDREFPGTPKWCPIKKEEKEKLDKNRSSSEKRFIDNL